MLSAHRITITRFFAAIFVIILVMHYHPWQCSMIAYISLKLVGFLLLMVCVAGRIWSATYIGGRKTKHLVAEGPYSIVRHPLYVFSLLGGIGIGVSSMNTYLLVTIGLYFGCYYPSVMYYEEQKMLCAHGENYKDYRSRVPAFIPKFSLFQNPDELVIKPKKFQRDLIHAMYFLAIYLLFETVLYIHTI